MIQSGLRAGAFGLLLLAGACAGFDPAPDAPVSPRAECASQSVTIYFPEESATLQPLSDPLIGRMMEHVNACTAAGGELRQIRVTAYPDSRGNRARGEAEMRERGARIRAALVEAGAPNSAIRIVRPRGEHGTIMQRRAEIVADLW